MTRSTAKPVRVSFEINFKIAENYQKDSLGHVAMIITERPWMESAATNHDLGRPETKINVSSSSVPQEDLFHDHQNYGIAASGHVPKIAGELL